MIDFAGLCTLSRNIPQTCPWEVALYTAMLMPLGSEYKALYTDAQRPPGTLDSALLMPMYLPTWDTTAATSLPSLAAVTRTCPPE